MLKKLFAYCVLVLSVGWALTHFSDLHAGQIYYYDTKGNLISEEAYQVLVDKLNRPNIR
jgi:hypothetical protein